MAPRHVGRVVARSTFAALRRPSGRAKNGPLQAVFSPLDDHQERAQVAFAVSKRCGGAVERNRIRRRLRSAVELISPPPRPGAYLVRTDPSVGQETFQDLIHCLDECFQKASASNKERTA